MGKLADIHFLFCCIKLLNSFGSPKMAANGSAPAAVGDCEEQFVKLRYKKYVNDNYNLAS